MVTKRKLITPIALPVLFFGAAILLGTVLLHMDFCLNNLPLSWIDSLFTATSAVCVTGLSVVDAGTFFNRTGQSVLLFLIQIGGLGIMSFTSLAFYLLNKRVSLTDRITVGQDLLHDSSFHLGRFLVAILTATLIIEGFGAVSLYLADSAAFPPFSALFHSVSAFCNAGFSLHSDSLVSFRDNWPINIVFMVLIILGGIGFAIMVEGRRLLMLFLRGQRHKIRPSYQFVIVINTTLLLIGLGWVYIYFSEFINYREYLPFKDALLTSLFQSVTLRTAGFNSLDISSMTNASLVFMIFLMFVGGAPGSCAGGIKVTTFRVLHAFIVSQIKGAEQATIGRFAIDKETLNRALSLVFFSLVMIFVSVLLLDFTEGGDLPHDQVRGLFLEIVFEAFSAFGTVGLTTGLTAQLTLSGKIIIICLMFTGRLGPLLLLGIIQSLRRKILYKYAEEKLSIG